MYEDRPDPWRRASKRDGCYCHQYRKPCERHDGYDTGWDDCSRVFAKYIAELKELNERSQELLNKILNDD